jgi:S1-C subfamily serine protease
VIDNDGAMRRVIRSHFISAVLGGLVVGAGLVAVGAAGRGHTETIVEEAPVASGAAGFGSGVNGLGSGLTAHDIYQRDAPGVVYIRAKLLAPVQSPFDMFHERESSTSTGSGFLVDGHGDVLTDYHVVDGAARTGGVTVEFEDATIRPAGVVAVDPGSDLAVLRVDMRGVPAVAPLKLGDSTTVRVGDPTLTIGNPFGVDRTLSSGIVSALQHTIQASDGRTINNVIQTDQPINAGNSGGPLLDAGGYVVGINSQVAITGVGARPGQSLAFAVPIDTADPILHQVAHTTQVRLAFIGLVGRPSRARSGVVVRSVVRAGPAEVAGIRPGDLIERVDGDPVDSLSDVLTLVSTRSPGQTLPVLVRRGRRTRTLTVVLGSQTTAATPGH